MRRCGKSYCAIAFTIITTSNINHLISVSAAKIIGVVLNRLRMDTIVKLIQVTLVKHTSHVRYYL